jgi:hypothetical protein
LRHRDRARPVKIARVAQELLPDTNAFEELALRTIRALGGEIQDRAGYYRKGIELGGFTEAQLAVPPPPGNQASFNNKVEFSLSFALSHLKHAGRLENPHRGVWRLPQG